MSNTLGQRVRMLIRADAHGVLEALEERPLLLKQSLRDAEFELGRKSARIAVLADDEKRLRAEIERGRKALSALDSDVALALEQDHDDLARFALRKLLPLRAHLDAVDVEVAGRADERSELEARLRDQQQRFDVLVARVRVDLARGAAAPRDVGWPSDRGASDEEVEIELLRRSRGRAEGDPDA